VGRRGYGRGATGVGSEGPHSQSLGCGTLYPKLWEWGPCEWRANTHPESMNMKTYYLPNTSTLPTTLLMSSFIKADAENCTSI